jgi:hypothetical protein
VPTASSLDATPFRIAGAHGDDLLGGELLDLRLVDWSLDELRAGGHTELADRLETPDGLRWSLALREQARAAKHALSEVAWAPIVVEAGDQQVVLTVTSEEFDRLVLPDIDAAVGLVYVLLGEADLDTASIGAVYLSGGSSYVRAAQRQLTSFLGFAPAPLDDPKLVTALGALDVRAALASEASGQVAGAGGGASTVCGNFPPVEDAWGDLAEGLATYLRGGGRTALDHVSRIRGRLADLHPDRSLEVNLLLTALRDGAVAEMRSAPDAAAAIQQLSERLVRDHALTPHNARAALATWASALARSDDGS